MNYAMLVQRKLIPNIPAPYVEYAVIQAQPDLKAAQDARDFMWYAKRLAASFRIAIEQNAGRKSKETEMARVLEACIAPSAEESVERMLAVLLALRERAEGKR